MEENSTKEEVVVSSSEGTFLNKKSIVIFIIIIMAIILVTGTMKGSKNNDNKNDSKGKFEENMVNSNVSDIPEDYSDLEKNKKQNMNTNTNNDSYPRYEEERHYQEINNDLEKELQKLYQDAELAKRSGIGFSANNKSYGQNGNNQNNQNSNVPQDYDMNRQSSKNDFLRNVESNPNYLNTLEEYPISPFEVKAGTIIPGVMITGINSDLPGNIVGQVRETVYDTVSGNHLLIPQGTKIFGKYDSNVTWGQERALIVWQRLIFPNGKSINLSNMPGVDLTGQAGFKDKVNHHFGTLLKGVLLTSVAGAGASIVTDNDSDDDSTDYASEAGRAAGIAVINIGNKFADKALDRQPTIEIRPGYRFNIMVHRDMILSPYE